MGNFGWKGLKCADCALPPSFGLRRCSACTLEHRERERNRYAKAKARREKERQRSRRRRKAKEATNDWGQYLVHRGAGL